MTQAKIVQDVAQAMDHYTETVNVSASTITTVSFECVRGVAIKALAANTGIVYIGNSDVTAGTAAATDGYPLAAGEELFLPIDDPNKVFAVGSVANQKLSVLVV